MLMASVPHHPLRHGGPRSQPAGRKSHLTLPPLVNLWMYAVATPGMSKHTPMTAIPGRISNHIAAGLPGSNNTSQAP